MPYCEECGQECGVKIIDEGIGPYECHGYKGNDVQLEAVSDCHDAPVYKDAALTQLLSAAEVRQDEDDGRGDWLYDQEKDRRLEEKFNEED